MDETPLKAGRVSSGKMRQAYFWPMYGDADEIVFHYAPSRHYAHVTRLLGKDFAGTLLTDGYGAYDAYAKNNQAVKQAQCWAHTRRYFEEAKDADPQAVGEALTLIGALYHHEQVIRDRELDGEAKLAYRTQNTEPIVKAFWRWCEVQCHRPEMTPKHPLAIACDTCAIAWPACRCSSPTRTYRSTRATWSGRCDGSRWGAGTGCSVGRSLAQNRSGSSRA